MKGKLLATLGLGAALVFGNAGNGLAEESDVCSGVEYETNFKLIDTVTYHLDNDEDRTALTYLNYINNPDLNPVPNGYPSLDDIEPALEEFVDKYVDCEYMRHKLYNLAKTFNEEKKKDLAVKYLGEELDNIDTGLTGDRSFSYHVMLMYNMELKKNGNIEDTHNAVRKNYEENDFAPWVFFFGSHFKLDPQEDRDRLDSVLKSVEERLPTEDSDLMFKIDQYCALELIQWYV